MPSDFPIRGVVGVLGGARADVQSGLAALTALETPPGGGSLRPGGPDAVEIRADLFEDPPEALEVLRRLPPGLPAIFTVRLPEHGGKYSLDEGSRIALYEDALSLGARLLDVERGSDAARDLAGRRAPLVVSWHDFNSMPGPAELERLTREMASLSPLGIKLVPVAQEPVDSVRMLEWVAAARPGEPARIGFAMGEMGLASRVLSIAWGAPFTYAAMGAPVAPGQTSVADLKDLYRAHRLTRSTRVFGVIGNPVAHSLSPHLHNPALAARGIDAVYLPLRLETFPELEHLIDPLKIDGLSVTIPFKEAALRFADEPDERSRSSGAANTLVIERQHAGNRVIRAYNTDFDGVLGPLARRKIEVRGLSAGIIGNGGAARGAARALKDSGARVTIYFRNPARGRPVAGALGVDASPIEQLTAGRHQLIVNATPLGMHAGDASPVPASVFDPGTWAFDMIYDPPGTPFLEAARAAGGRIIPGREMLICQALVQFRLFTGREATYEELEASFLRAQASRGR